MGYNKIFLKSIDEIIKEFDYLGEVEFIKKYKDCCILGDVESVKFVLNILNNKK